MDEVLVSAGAIDYFIIFSYFLFVILVGLIVRKLIKSDSDFFLSGRSLPAWITGIAYLAANLGALELLGMAASGAQYGMLTMHYYWVGAVPAMIFVGLYMYPFFYASKARTIPEYLRFRYNEATRGLNAITFFILTILFSGISLYAMGLIFSILLGWSMSFSIVVAAIVVLLYVSLGGLTSSIYNEVIQFFLIWIGLLPIALIGMYKYGGISGILSNMPESFTHLWQGLGSTADNPMGVSWFGIIVGLSFVLSFGYWMTDFLVAQRAFAAKDVRAAQNTPIYASFFRIIVPIVVIVPGFIAIPLFPELGQDPDMPYNLALPLTLAELLPEGLFGLGITALLAAFMSGMAGNITAFTTVWTYDIYQAYIKKEGSDKHYIKVGRIMVVIGTILAVFAAFIAAKFPNIMDYIQMLFSFFNAPFFATFFLGVFWKRATGWGAFWGLLLGITSSFLMYFLIPSEFYSTMAEGNFSRALWAWIVTMVITIVVSLFTKPKPEIELRGLVRGVSETISYKDLPWYKRPGYLSVISLIIMAIINIYLW